MNHRLFALPLLGLLASTSACIISSGDDSSLTVYNDSDFVIEELNVTEVDNPSWGPDLLGGQALFPDESITISLDCDTYDARLIDSDGVECFLDAIDLCFDDADWVIRNNSCSVWTAGAARHVDESELAPDASVDVEAADAPAAQI